MRELGRVVHGVWGSDISIAMVVPRSGTKPCGRQGLAQVSQRERAQMEPCNPKIRTCCDAGPYGEQLAGVGLLYWLVVAKDGSKRVFRVGPAKSPVSQPCV